VRNDGVASRLRAGKSSRELIIVKAATAKLAYYYIVAFPRVQGFDCRVADARERLEEIHYFTEGGVGIAGDGAPSTRTGD
jgi:hypothetical protein